MFCKKCGTENLDSARFCKSCGDKIGNSQFANSALIKRSFLSNKKSIVTLITIIIIGGASWFGYDYYDKNYSYVRYTDSATDSMSSVKVPIPVSDSNFTIDKNGVLTKYIGSSKNVVIPNGVKRIAEGAIIGVLVTDGEDGKYAISKNISSIVIPDSVTIIDKKAFETAGCWEVREIVIPNSVTSIGDEAFSSCGSLVRVTMPNNIPNMGNRVFSNTSIKNPIVLNDGKMLYYVPKAYETYAIPSSVTSIGNEAFSGTNIKNLIIPEGVKNIGNNVFGRHKDGFGVFSGYSPSSISIPESIESIGDSAFGTIEINGYKGSYAEDFAKTHGYIFKSLGNAKQEVSTTKKFCDADTWFCSKNKVCPNTLGDGKYIIVALTDVGVNSWGSAQTSCNQPQCESSNGENNLVADNTINFSNYPARDICKYMGGRLPTAKELQCIYDNQADFGTFNTVADYGHYWSNTENNEKSAYAMDFNKGNLYGNRKIGGSDVRCVKAW